MAEDTGKSLYNKKGKLKHKYDERPPITSQKWEVSLEQDAENTVQLAIGQDGPHDLIIEGDNACGSSALSWELE
jgi:hypothetical protein